MYCTHCGKKINEDKIERKKSSYDLAKDQTITENTKVVYTCPRCGFVIHSGLDNEEEKSLSRAAHAEIQRGHNSFSKGMSSLCIGAILIIIAFIFYRLSHKATNNFQLSTNCVEFYVFLVLLIISIVLIIVGIVFVTLGLIKIKNYKYLLRSIQNKTFVQ